MIVYGVITVDRLSMAQRSQWTGIEKLRVHGGNLVGGESGLTASFADLKSFILLLSFKNTLAESSTYQKAWNPPKNFLQHPAESLVVYSSSSTSFHYNHHLHSGRSF